MPFADYKNFEDCVKKNQDKNNPESYCATIQKKAEGEKMRWNKLEYYVPIELTEATKLKPEEDFIIQGVAINETITRNNVKYTAEELNLSAETLNDKPILKDHRNEIDAIVGRTTNSKFDSKKKAVMFEGIIRDKKIQEMINDGRIKNVSIGAKVKDLVKEEKDGTEYVVAKGLEFLELSLVPVPGDAGASLAQALHEAYKLKEEEHIECPECEKEFETKKELSDHMKKTGHGMEKDKEEKMEVSKEDFNALKAELEAMKLENKKNADLIEKTKLKEDIKQELLKEIKTEEKRSSTKGIIVNEDEHDYEGYILEELGQGRMAFWQMPKHKGGN